MWRETNIKITLAVALKSESCTTPNLLPDPRSFHPFLKLLFRAVLIFL